MNPLDSAETAADLLQSLFGLEGKVVVVTGGGTGPGRETARLFAGAGATVIVADLDVSRARHVADEASVAALLKLSVTSSEAQPSSSTMQESIRSNRCSRSRRKTGAACWTTT